MKRSLLLIASIVLGASMVGCSTTQDNNSQIDGSVHNEQAAKLQSVTGTLLYRERIALPEDAVIQVTLEDASIADTKAVVIAKDTFVAGGKQVPFSFQLDYKKRDIQPKHTYVVRAKILVKDKLRFTTDTMRAVITDPGNTQSVNLILVGVK